MRYPKGLSDFIRSNSIGKSNKEIAELANAKLGLRMTAQSMKAYRANHHLPPTGLTGRFEKGHPSPNKGVPMSPHTYEMAKATMFKKGQKPWNDIYQIGDTRIVTNMDGRQRVVEKVSDKGTLWERWRSHPLLVLQRAGIAVGKDEIVYHLNKDPLDNRLENLATVKKSLYPLMSRKGLITKDKEAMKTGELLAEMTHRRYELESKARKRRKKEKKNNAAE